MASGYTERILLRDYDGGESDSPLTSLENFQAPSKFTSDSSNISFSSPLSSIEQPPEFQFYQPYKCHILSKMDFPDLKNNMLAMSWPFHQLFDGLNTIDEVSGGFDIPLIALKPTPLFAQRTILLMIMAEFENP